MSDRIPKLEFDQLPASIADALRTKYERFSVNLGFGRDWVEQVERLEPQRARLTDRERTLQRFVIDAVAADGRDVTPQLDAVVDALGYGNAVAVMMVMARYTTHALLVNCLRIEPPGPSIFADGYTGKIQSRTPT